MKSFAIRSPRAPMVGAFVALLVALMGASLLVPETPAEAVSTRVTGNDISWPQCPKGTGIPVRRGQGKPMPGPSSRFVIVGLTNGPGFYPNPCLRSQVRWIKNHHVRAAAYSMTTYPTRRQLAKFGAAGPHPHKHLYGRLWNTGYAQAQFNLDTMKTARLRSPFIWVDVEPYTVSPWTRNRTNNAAVIRGVVAGYQRGGHRVGFYSTQSLWAQIVGKLRYGYPEWRTAGQTSMASALHKCSHAPIQGGRAVIAQWWTPRRDYDVMCPGHAGGTELRRYFTKY